MNTFLTIVIPTYNRPDQLRDVLNKLQLQTNQHYEIIISNNASNYDVDKLVSEFSLGFTSKITVINKRINVGMALNIIDSFSLFKSKWLWILSDDEYVREDAVDTIYKTITEQPNVGCFNFTLSEKFKSWNDCVEIRSIKDLINIYGKDKSLHGDLIFISNKIFNIDRIREYMGDAFKYVYTQISITIIIERMLEESVPYVIINKRIVDYNSTSPRSWRIYEIVLASRTLSDVKFSVPKNTRKELLYILSFDITYVYYLYFVEGTEIKNEKYFFDQLYNGLYKYILPIDKRLLLKVVSQFSKSSIGYELIRAFFKFRYSDSLLKKVIKKILRK